MIRFTNVNNLTFASLATGMLLLGLGQSSYSGAAAANVHLSSPQDRASVGRTETAKGTLAVTSNEDKLWVLVRPTTKDNAACHFTTDQWYPQTKPRVDDGIWEARLSIGPNPADVGCKYEITAIIFNVGTPGGKKTQDSIDNYFRAGRECMKRNEDNCWEPIDIPNDHGAILKQETVTVIRK